MSGASPFSLSGSHTLTLGEGGDRVLRVTKGEVDLFFVCDFAPMQGRRHHFASIPAGGWIFDVGFGRREHGVSVLAAGQAGAEVVLIDPSTEPSWTGKLEDWIRSLKTGIAGILPGSERDVPPLLPSDVPPLQGPGGFDEVARVHDRFLRAVRAGAQEQRGNELRSRERRFQFQAAAGDAAWSQIASVLHKEQAVTLAMSETSLAAAFECVARECGITPRIPAQLPAGMAALAAMVRKSSIRMRWVSLEGQWYLRDNGPLIGFLKDGEAVSLLPGKGRTFLQKADGRREEVRGQTPLEQGAVMLYRTLPDRRLTFGDVVDFCRWQMGADARLLWLMVLLGGLFGIAFPLLTVVIFDMAVPQAERHVMVQVGVFLGVAAVAKAVLELVRGIALVRMENRASLHLQAALWDRLLKLPARFFRGHTSGDLAARAQGVSEMQEAISSVGMAVLFALPVGFFNLLVMFFLSRELACWGLGLALLAVSVSVVCNAGQVIFLRRQMDIQGKLAGLVFQLVKGMAKFRTAGAGDLAFAAWAKDYTSQQRHSVKAGRWGVVAKAFFSGYWLLAALVIFAAMAGLEARGEGMRTGAFLAFCAAFGALVASLMVVGDNSLHVLKLIPALDRTKPLLSAEPEVAGDRSDPGSLTGEMELDGVTFRYGKDLPAVLENFSLRIKPGEFVALVGPSGSGKSTILRLLLGFEVPEKGAVLYDGRDLQSLDPGAVRRQAGVVLQNTDLFAGDIFRNIAGNSAISVGDAWKAAEMAGLAEDIRAMPMQMHTLVGEGGGTFSGGQRQRIAIARALARKPRFFFFDEPTSALDNRTQAAVFGSLDDLPGTRVVIAHRLSTVRQADRIVVIRDGRKIEEGSYAELMEKKGFFHELAIRQLPNAEL